MTSETRSFIDSFIWTAKQDALFAFCMTERQGLIREIEQISKEAAECSRDDWERVRKDLEQRCDEIRKAIDKATNEMLISAGLSVFVAARQYADFGQTKLGEFAQGLEWAAVDAWNNRDHQAKPLPLMITDQSRVFDHNGENYIASIRRPDGSVVRVLIPVEGVDCHANDVAIESAARDPRGLNLVSEGHYS